MWKLTLLLFTLGAAYLVLTGGGAVTPTWNLALIPIGAGAILCGLSPQAKNVPPRLPAIILVPLLAFPVFAALQLVPLPLPVLNFLSPQRVDQIAALHPISPSGMAPLSVVPPATVDYLFRILAYLAVLFTIRSITWLSSGREWIVVAPLLLIATLESAMGMVQVIASGPGAMALGTYLNHDHFAGLLEMILPFAIMASVAVLSRTPTRQGSAALPALFSGALAILAGLFFVAITYSLSRMGFIVVLLSLFGIVFLITVSLIRSKWRGLGITLCAASLVLVAFLFLAPAELISRFAEVTAVHTVSSDARLSFWKGTLSLIHAYPLVGCGLGAFESAFQPFQAALPSLSVGAAHNDYLQFLAELGIAGFLIPATLVIGVLGYTVRVILRAHGLGQKCLPIACLVSMLAMLTHSLVDFNMQLPGNALIMAWVAGIAVGL